MNKKKIIVLSIGFILVSAIIIIDANTGIKKLKRDYLKEIKKEYVYEMKDVSTDEECYVAIIDLVKWYNACIDDIDYYTYYNQSGYGKKYISEYVTDKYGEYSIDICKEVSKYVAPYAEKTKNKLAVQTEKCLKTYICMLSDMDEEKADEYIRLHGPVTSEAFSSIDMHTYLDVGSITEDLINSASIYHWYKNNSIDTNFSLKIAYYGNYDQCISTLVDVMEFADGYVDNDYGFEYTHAGRKLEFASQMIDSINGWEIVTEDGRTLEMVYKQSLEKALKKFNKKKAEKDKTTNSNTNNNHTSNYYYGPIYNYDPYDVDEYDDPDDFADEWEDEFDDWDDAYDYWEENH